MKLKFNMWSIINYLQDPQSVAEFQKMCGIRDDRTNKPKAKAKVSTAHGWSDGECYASYGDSSPDKSNGMFSNGSYHSQSTDKLKPEMQEKSNSASVRQRSFTDLIDSESDNSNGEDIDSGEYTIHNNFLYYLFSFAASLGNEIFYITFFPFWFWNIDGYVGRRICIFWCIFMYLGQAAKDLIRWPRPASPPVIRMEKRYALEYGMPSTHAMVGAGVPFAILFLTSGRYIFPFEIGLAVATCWCTLVAFSRLYLGMHTILDVIAGLAFVFGLMPVVFSFVDTLDDFLLHSSYSPAICVLIPLILAICYPTLDKWSTARGDTTVVLAVCGGVALGHWVCYQYGLMERASTPPPYNIIPPSFTWFGQMLLRLSIGVVILFSTRAVMKTLTFNLICWLTKQNKKDAKAQQKLIIELPIKFFTYMAIGFNSVYLAPQVFRYMGIERPTYFTEI